MKQPRKLKKAIKNCRVILDICSIPLGFTYETMMYEFKVNGIIFWDSRLGGVRPKFQRQDKRIKVIDWKIYEKKKLIDVFENDKDIYSNIKFNKK
jgi:hypothetical protein